MNHFQKEQLPFSVAVVDMDWHVVDPSCEDGGGWTGYTFDSSLFPHPDDFLLALHDRKLRVTLNLHPSAGIRSFEKPYEEMCRCLGLDPTERRPINFDIANPNFAQAYLDTLHHPLESLGVDFWWIDWQQTNYTSVKGLTPLWMLNHLHTYDLARNGKRPLCFSRYAGVGSHRYPIGFSGDTVISWESLSFQPEFTATATNIGFLWWSHAFLNSTGVRYPRVLCSRIWLNQ